ncbi:hypothetical protein HYALB_00001394 [Hymenoscyphus albidus]|uniref:HECT-type E3 ubiquitin transferase n=1 Tax=Hymenoscyphus albidus TaxID=595503 RepID=A0A9N9LDJ3_9HELO|nr:hypothetical protein HYALB_00001394 [Hymenoscyphus albidus]
MAPWSNRILSPNPRPDHSLHPAGSSPARPPPRVPPRVTESDILEGAYEIPTLAATSNGAIGTPPHGPASSSKPTRTASNHGRSMSHPFPSFFPGKKKRHDDGVGGNGLDSTDDDLSGSSPMRPQKLERNAKQKVPEKDLTTGKCMTCDSMVRWPKNLGVFRCTVCLTINDLKPILLEARRGDGHRAPVAVRPGTSPGSAQPRVPLLSLEKTKRLIDQCITSFLLDQLKHGDGHTASPHPSPPVSPRWPPSGSGNIEEPLDGTHRDSPTNPTSTMRSPPIQLSYRPVDQHGHSPLSKPPPGYIGRPADPGPYSSSSPGMLYGPMSDEPEQTQNPHRPNETLREPANSGFHRPNGKERVDDVPRNQNNNRNPFKPLEDYIISSFGSLECINASFSVGRPPVGPRAASEGLTPRRWMPIPGKHVEKQAEHTERHIEKQIERQLEADGLLSELDAKTLLLGDFAENGSWWTGNRSDAKSPEKARTWAKGFDGQHDRPDIVTLRTPRVHWSEVNEWYSVVLNAGRSWRRRLDALISSENSPDDILSIADLDLGEIENQIMEAQLHTQRVLLKATESLLKRPGRPLSEPHDVRFILIILANPLLYPSAISTHIRDTSRSRSPPRDGPTSNKGPKLEPPRTSGRSSSPGSRNVRKGSSGQHSGIIKRVLGILANLPNECHHHLVSWFARYSDPQFRRTVDLIGSFVTYRLTRQHGKQQESRREARNDLIPNMSGTGRVSSAALHAALGAAGGGQQPPKKSDGKPPPVVYNDDWQIKAAARVMALFFAANNSGQLRKGDNRPATGSMDCTKLSLPMPREIHQRHGQILATSDFYNTLLDYSDLVADFEAWESRRGKFSFCQYPFFLSIWAKIQIMEHDARRQMEVKAREAFFDSIMTRQMVNQYLVLKVRRDCLVEDSLKGVSEVVGAGGEEIKKGLRIEFKGEEGIDAGGLRKEWFLLLVRDVFNPEHGMFTYDDDSQFCYFNPNSFETTNQFFLVGVVLGLAIYNSTILDVALPPFAFRKLLAAGPAPPPGATSHAKPSMTYSLEDLAEFRPALATGLRQLLEFEGDVETTFCRDFVADVERFGQVIQVPLCADGDKRPVTNSNRREFVDLYVRYLLDLAVARQFEPFKRGFFTVCGGNALSLFRPEEIERLIRGSDEPLDIGSLRVVSICENWGVPNAKETESVVHWFWESFQNANVKDQRKLLTFITGSDRIPAMGATNLIIKLSCLGDDCNRFPQARTCFNMLSLWRYSSQAKLNAMLWRAVYESEGFGLK